MEHKKNRIGMNTVALIFAVMVLSCSDKDQDSTQIEPIHLDDIHLIVTDENETVAFFEKHFGAKEMAHPGDRFDLARFLSLKWQGPTITVTPIGPYKDLPPERNQRWLAAKIISPKSEKRNPVYGVKWLGISTISIDKARAELMDNGVAIFESHITLPLEPDSPAFSIYGPDGLEIVIVERPEYDFGDATYAIDHIQFLVKDIKSSQTFFENIFSANHFKRKKKSVGLQVADAKLILSEPEEFGLTSKDVSLRKVDGAIRIGLDHLGFLYRDINMAVDQAKLKGYSPIFKPQRYIYKNKPTVYTFTAFELHENIHIEMVQADGRIGPHSYYLEENNFK